MPNYCNNSVSLFFSNQDLYKEFRSFMGDFFSFEKIAPTPTELLNFSSPIKDDKLAEVFMEKYGAKDWYDWRVKNWGTKWDVAISNDEKYPDTHLTEESTTGLSYNFNTAWSPPIEAITKLSEQYPDVTFNLSYEEETGWGGEVEFENGAHEIGRAHV